MLPRKHAIFIFVITTSVFVVGILAYFKIHKGIINLRTTEYQSNETQIQKPEPGDAQPQDISSKELERIEGLAEGTTTILKTEETVCNSQTYIFNTIKEGGNYFTELYEDNKSKDNLILRSRAQRELVYGGKPYTEIMAFSILTTPSTNCDRIYLTNILPISHPVPAQGIFEWRIGAQEIRELAISKEFAGNHVPYPSTQGRIAPISPDGEKIIVAKQGNLTGENRWCNYKSLYLLDLREDIARPLVKLTDTESLDNGTSDLDPYCGGLNFGWQNESLIYYDVYNAMVAWNRPLLERRTLKVNRND